MTDQPENLVLKHLIELRAEVKTSHEQTAAQLKRIEDRFTNLENMVRGITSIMAGIIGQMEGIQSRLTRLEQERES